jgi:hypothetical protein
MNARTRERKEERPELRRQQRRWRLDGSQLPPRMCRAATPSPTRKAENLVGFGREKTSRRQADDGQ